VSLFSESDVASLRTDRLALMAQTYLQGVSMTDAFLLGKLQAAEAEIGRQLKVLLEPTTIFSVNPPTQDQIDALAGAPFLVEPGYDYDPEFFQAERWGYLVIRQHPIISVSSILLFYPTPTAQVFAIPADWLRVDFKYGHIRMIPASSQFFAPLGAFLMQVLGGGQTIPSMIQVQYVAGLKDAKADFPDLIDVIKKKTVLSIIEDAFVPGGSSISADGLSQSVSLKMADYEDLINLKLFGPKGANGGLWTAIHGIPMAILGSLA
jgi:hypothetical protein